MKVTFLAEGSRDARTLWLGDDDRGVALEIVTVPLRESGLLVIHAMLLRDKYRGLYEGGDNP